MKEVETTLKILKYYTKILCGYIKYKFYLKLKIQRLRQCAYLKLLNKDRNVIKKLNLINKLTICR